MDRPVYIEAQNLTRYFGDQCAVNRVSFTIRKGEVVGFLGPNGSGKTTTMRMLVGYLLPDKGKCSVLGVDPVEDPETVRKYTGYLPENNPLYLDMYVREFLYWMAKMSGVSRARHRVEEVMEQVGLLPEAHKPIEALSRGYRQRVGLAHALLHQPSVFILDEPTSGLDPNQVQEIRALIRELGKDHTILLSTHILQEVEEICTRVLLIHRGKLLADASISDLKRMQRGIRRIHLEIQSVSIHEVQRGLEEWRSEIPFSISWQVRSLPLGNVQVVVESEGGEDIRPGLFHLVVRRGWTLLALYEEEVRLEEVFRLLTRESSRVEESSS